MKIKVLNIILFLEKELNFNEQIVKKTYFFICYFANCKCFFSPFYSTKADT